MMKTICYCFIALILIGCTSAKQRVFNKIDNTLKADFFDNQFTGFLLIDPQTKDTLYNQNSSKYFTPASNTKIFTLYTSLKLLPEKIPALKYVFQNDTLFITGTGNPTLLHPYFKDSTAINFLKGYTNVSLYLDNFKDEKFGLGWSWDDYHWYYSPERSGFPMYGNILTLHQTDSLQVLPHYFIDKVVSINHPVNREWDKNIFYFDPTRKDTLEIPFRVDSTLTLQLLENALQKKVALTHRMPEAEKKVLYSIPSDSVYKRMMWESDNFLAEQLLILVSSTLSDTLNSAKAREYVLEKHLSDLKQSPRWVDGSGLSRYNLFSPQSIVQVLEKMYADIPRARLFSIFPSGGVSGTLVDWYSGDTTPYIYAKSGSLGNNYCLSGYLLTKSGKVLIFSFMNNHFRQPTSEIKKRMQLIFETVRDTF